MMTTAEKARSMLGEMLTFVEEYLEEGGPLWMLEHGTGGPEDERLQFHDRPMYPERLHVVALAIDLTTQLLDTVDRYFSEAADQVASWPTTSDSSITPNTRARLEQIRDRHNRPPAQPPRGTQPDNDQPLR